MKKITFFFLFISFIINAQQQTVNFSVSPSTFAEDEAITVTVSNINPSSWGVTDVYLWSWSYDSNDLNSMDSPTNGSWTSSNEAQKLTNNGNGTYSISYTPTTFYNRTNIGSIGMLVKAKNGDGDKKSQDIIFQVGDEPVAPNVIEATVPNNMLDGINLNPNDNSTVTLVLYAPNKEYVNLIGSFNDWQRDDVNFLLKKDSAKNRFWIELTGLTAQTDYSYQYLVDGQMRIADPYSTIILDENNDQYINQTTYPNLPSYPTGKTNHAVTLLRTGDTTFNWQTTNFQKPAKTDLVIYELLIRDFDALHSFDAVKTRLDYLQDMGINAIEFMPLMEFDGNESWGYNPSFHMALDKYYGNITAFKQLVDECHRRGIAVIIDVAFNHASGQNPYYRMWNTDNGGYGGQASADSPFFNQTATHSYSVFNDFNHSKQDVNDYVKRVSQYWIDEYKIDGFRWDLTKGFTQNCSDTNETCTNAYQQDRVYILKEYADDQWDIDPDFYIIFEHLGTNNEETQWVNYKLGEGKGIMIWGNHNYNYRQAAAGNNDESDFSWISYKNRGWSVPANVSYMESHDEERLMVENLNNGKSTGGYNIKTLATGLDRMEMAGAFYFTVPGPKMIWQFGELGYDISINQNGRTGNKPILWNYFEVKNRKDIYNTWSKLIELKLKYDIFETSDFIMDVASTNGLKKIQLTDVAASEIQYINIIGNFGVTTQNINPVFQKTGTWYNVLNNNTTLNVTNVNNLISLNPGEFKVYANKAAVLSTENLFLEDEVVVYPNPVKTSFRLNIDTNNVSIYDINGKEVKSFKGNFSTNKNFSVQEFKKGLYILKVSNSKGKTYQKLIVE
jgi:1,4-alpha-glucan branching enzyme